MLQFCHGGSRRGAHPKLALTWPWSSVVHGRAPNLTCLNPQPPLGGTAEGVCVAGPLPGQPLHTQRRPWGAAPGCFETGAGLIKARFCNGCSRFDWKARRGVGPWKLGQRGAPLGGSCRRSPEPTVPAESLSPCSPPPGDMDAKLLGGRRDNRDCQRRRHPKSDGGQSLEPYYNR